MLRSFEPLSIPVDEGRLVRSKGDRLPHPPSNTSAWLRVTPSDSLDDGLALLTVAREAMERMAAHALKR